MERGLKEKLAIFSHNPDAPRPEEVRRHESARSSAYKEGYEAGREAALAEAEDRNGQIDAVLRQLPTMVQALSAEIEQSHARAVATVLKTALPRLAARAAGEEVIAAIMETARSDLAGTIEVHSSIAFAQELAPLLKQITSSTAIRLIPDSTLTGYAIRLSWKGGGGEMDISGMIERCCDLIDEAAPEMPVPNGAAFRNGGSHNAGHHTAEPEQDDSGQAARE